MQTPTIQTLGQAVDYIQSLPMFEQKQIFGLIDNFVLEKNKSKQKSTSQKKRTAGTLKGKVVFAPDFDEPLKEFD
ncbi:DUF2281 domain-containing protein [Moraxella oblonga]|uniref:DUF2281 domain-containing protein n=1 Tax=Moraxella oblonga TaxID=200413 RepID=UPI000834BFD6|nr:DUF2281 domain-containing protein [Moraxella oblonga]